MDYACKLTWLTFKNNNKKRKWNELLECAAYLYTQETLKGHCSAVVNDSEISQTGLNIVLLLSD